MTDPGSRQRVSPEDCCKFLPRHPVSTSASTEPLPPDMTDLLIELPEFPVVRRSSVILVVAPELSEPFVAQRRKFENLCQRLYKSEDGISCPMCCPIPGLVTALAALLLQLRLRPDLAPTTRGPVWLNALGVAFALGAVFADFLHLNPALMPIAALAAVISFAASGLILLSALRKSRIWT